MNNRLIPVLIALALVIMGGIKKRIQNSKIEARIEKTSQYLNKFITLLNEFIKEGTVNSEIYHELISSVDSMQQELGSDGVIALYRDPLAGIQARDYQVLINFLPQIRQTYSGGNMSFMYDRFNQEACTCDDMFRRHIGNLNRKKELNSKGINNPFTCFAEGVKMVLELPVNILNWIGVIGLYGVSKVTSNSIFKLIEKVGIIVTLVAELMAIVLGWEGFIEILSNILK